MARANIVALPNGHDVFRRARLSDDETPTNPADLLREAVTAIAIMAPPDVPAIWCLATYAALIEGVGADRTEALVFALRKDCKSIRIDLSARSPAFDEIGQRARHLASAADLLGFERLARQSMALRAGPGGPTTGRTPYLVRSLTIAIDAIDAHFALAAA